MTKPIADVDSPDTPAEHHSLQNGDAFHQGYLVGAFLLGDRGEELSAALSPQDLPDTAARLLRGLLSPHQEGRARALAPELVRLRRALESRTVQ